MYELILLKKVNKYLSKLSVDEHERCITALEELRNNPFQKRPNCDIRKLSGKKDVYRLRVGNHRFTYDVKEDKILAGEAFWRGRGYR